MPEWEIERVYYFTASINPLTWAKAKRQKRLIRALSTLPDIRPVYGRYRADPADFPLLDDPDRTVTVLHTEEKQTDVNIAVQLLLDGVIEPAATKFVLVSNDSDQVLPVRLLCERGLEVGILNPRPTQASAELKRVASWARSIRPPNVYACQLPDVLHDAAEEFRKPPAW